MGFFSFIGDLVGRAVESIGDKIGDVTGWYGISDVGMAIQDVCSEEIGQEKSYEKSSANICTTERLNETLVSFSKKYLEHSEKLERECAQKIEQYFDELIKTLETSFKDKQCVVQLRQIRNNKSKIKKMINGSVKEPLAKRMSLDDAECLKILKLDSGTEKKEKMKKFSNKVFCEALDNLSQRVKKVLDEQTEDIEDALWNYLDTKDKEVKNVKKQYDDILKMGNGKSEDIQRNCMKPLLLLKEIEAVQNNLQV